MSENIYPDWSFSEVQNWTSQEDRNREIDRINMLLKQNPSKFSADEITQIRQEVKKLDEAHGALAHIKRTGYVERHGMPGYAAIIQGDISAEWQGARQRLLKVLEKPSESKSGMENVSSESAQ